MITHIRIIVSDGVIGNLFVTSSIPVGNLVRRTQGLTNERGDTVYERILVVVLCVSR